MHVNVKNFSALMKERIELANNPSAQKGNVEFDAAEREHKTILENLASKKNEHEAAKEHAQSVQLKEQNLKQELETVTARYQELYNSKYYKEQELYNEQAGESFEIFDSRPTNGQFQSEGPIITPITIFFHFGEFGLGSCWTLGLGSVLNKDWGQSQRAILY